MKKAGKYFWAWTLVLALLLSSVKKGNTTVTAKVVYKTGKKKTTKKLVVKVEVKDIADTQTPVPAKTPAPEPDASTVTTAPTDIETINITTEHKSVNGITTKDNGLMRKNWTSAEYMKFMGQVWNLGNTMESCGTGLPDTYTAKDFEKFWGAPETTQKTMDGISSIEYVPEDGLKTVYKWEGSWTRTEGSEAIPGGYELKSCDDRLNIQSNSAFLQFWANTDWSALSKPCIKITMANDEVSQNADLQVAYTTEADGPDWKGAMNPQTDWIGKCIPLNIELLKENKWLMLSSNKPGATIIKIEILDAK